MPIKGRKHVLRRTSASYLELTSCCYEHFTIKSSMREHPFLSVSSYQWECVRFQRTAAALDMPEHQIARLCLCVHVYSQINTAQHTSNMGFGGRQTATFHSIHNTFYRTLSAHETHENGWVGVDALKFVTDTDCCFIFCWYLFLQREHLRFCIRNLTDALNRWEYSSHSLSTFEIIVTSQALPLLLY